MLTLFGMYVSPTVDCVALSLKIVRRREFTKISLLIECIKIFFFLEYFLPISATLLPCETNARFEGIERPKCKSREGLPVSELFVFLYSIWPESQPDDEFFFYTQNKIESKFRPHSDQRHRIHAVREEMRVRASLHGSEIDAYIITSYDEHLNEDIADYDKRRQYISGFTGPTAVIVVSSELPFIVRTQYYSIVPNHRSHYIRSLYGRTNNIWTKRMTNSIAIGKYSPPMPSPV